MDLSWLALVAFLVVSVLVAGLMLLPRFRESVAMADPVVPGVLERLTYALDQVDSQDPVYADLSQALALDPIAVRREREAWRRRLIEASAAAHLLADLDAL